MGTAVCFVKKARRACVVFLVVIAALGGCARGFTPTTLPTASPTPSPSTPAFPKSPTVFTAAGLTIEEYAIVSATVDTPNHFEFLDRIPDDVLARREAWREPSLEKRIGAMNEKLAPFGYRLAAEGSGCVLYREEEPLVSDLRQCPRFVSVNESRTNFAFVAESKEGLILVQKDNVQPLDSDRWIYYRTPPIYLDDDLLTVERLDERKKEYPVTGGTMYIYPYAVKRGDRIVYTYTPTKSHASSRPRRLVAWEGHWILETVEGVFMDGESLNRRLGVDEIFHYVIFQGQPLFFFERGGEVRISYGGEALPISYDEVIHYQCCEPAMFNVGSNEHMLWFYALREGIWHYVEIGSYTDD